MRSVFFLVFAVVCSLMAPAACAQPLLSPEQFRDAGAAEIREAAPGARIEVIGQHLIRITIPDDPARDGMEINFERAYRAYLQDPSQRDALLNQWLRMALETPISQLTRERLVVVVRSEELVDGYNHHIRQSQPDARLITQPFIGDLHAVLAFDTGEAIGYAVPERIEELGLSVDEAWSIGFANLDSLMGDLRVATDAEGISYVDSESGLAPSFLLNSEVCRSGAAGDLILVTSRDGYIFADRRIAARIHARASIVIGPTQPESRTILSCRSGRLTLESE